MTVQSKHNSLFSLYATLVSMQPHPLCGLPPFPGSFALVNPAFLPVTRSAQSHGAVLNLLFGLTKFRLVVSFQSLWPNGAIKRKKNEIFRFFSKKEQNIHVLLEGLLPIPNT